MYDLSILSSDAGFTVIFDGYMDDKGHYLATHCTYDIPILRILCNHMKSTDEPLVYGRYKGLTLKEAITGDESDDDDYCYKDTEHKWQSYVKIFGIGEHDKYKNLELKPSNPSVCGFLHYALQDIDRFSSSLKIIVAHIKDITLLVRHGRNILDLYREKNPEFADILLKHQGTCLA